MVNLRECECGSECLGEPGQGAACHLRLFGRPRAPAMTRKAALAKAVQEEIEREVEVYSHLGCWHWRRRDGDSTAGPFADAFEASLHRIPGPAVRVER